MCLLPCKITEATTSLSTTFSPPSSSIDNHQLCLVVVGFFFSENRLNCPRWWIQQEQIALKFYLCFHCTPLLCCVRFKKLVWFSFIYHLLLCYQANNRYLVTNSGDIEWIQGFIKAWIHCLGNINIEYCVSPSGMLSHSIIPSHKKSCWWF